MCHMNNARSLGPGGRLRATSAAQARCAGRNPCNAGRACARDCACSTGQKGRGAQTCTWGRRANSVERKHTSQHGATLRGGMWCSLVRVRTLCTHSRLRVPSRSHISRNSKLKKSRSHKITPHSRQHLVLTVTQIQDPISTIYSTQLLPNSCESRAMPCPLRTRDTKEIEPGSEK